MMLSFLHHNARWLAVGMILTFSSSYGQTYFISLFSGQIRAEFGLSHGQWGWTYTLGTLASAILLVWVGSLTDIMRVRKLGPLILVGLAGACLAMAITPWAWTLPIVIFALRFFGQGMATHIAVVAMSRWFVANRGKALSVSNLGFSMGEAALPIIVVSALVVVAWQWMWVAAALAALLAIPMLVSLLRQERTPQSLIKENPSLGMSGLHWTRSMTLNHWVFWMMIPALLGPSAFNTAFFFQQVHFAEVKDWTHLSFVALFPLYVGTAVLSMFAFGAALDRWGTGRILPYTQIPMVLAFVIFATTDSLALAAVGFIFLGITSGSNATVPNAFWAEFYGTQHLGAIKSIATAIMVFASAIGPGITGVMIDRGVGIELQYYAVAGFFCFTTIVMIIGLAKARKLLPIAA